MKPVDFPKATTTFNAPPGEEDRVYALRAYLDPAVPEVIECWRPTWRERLSILVFGRVWVRFLARNPQPVDLEGKRTVFEPARSQAPAAVAEPAP